MAETLQCIPSRPVSSIQFIDSPRPCRHPMVAAGPDKHFGAPKTTGSYIPNAGVRRGDFAIPVVVICSRVMIGKIWQPGLPL